MTSKSKMMNKPIEYNAVHRSTGLKTTLFASDIEANKNRMEVLDDNIYIGDWIVTLKA